MLVTRRGGGVRGSIKGRGPRGSLSVFAGPADNQLREFFGDVFWEQTRHTVRARDTCVRKESTEVICNQFSEAESSPVSLLYLVFLGIFLES